MKRARYTAPSRVARAVAYYRARSFVPSAALPPPRQYATLYHRWQERKSKQGETSSLPRNSRPVTIGEGRTWRRWGYRSEIKRRASRTRNGGVYWRSGPPSSAARPDYTATSTSVSPNVLWSSGTCANLALAINTTCSKMCWPKLLLLQRAHTFTVIESWRSRVLNGLHDRALLIF